jgi:hypothetical protein
LRFLHPQKHPQSDSNLQEIAATCRDTQELAKIAQAFWNPHVYWGLRRFLRAGADAERKLGSWRSTAELLPLTQTATK